MRADINYLRQLYDAGQLSNAEMDEAERQNALADLVMPQPNYDIAPMDPNTMRFENGPEAGRTVPLGPTLTGDNVMARNQERMGILNNREAFERYIKTGELPSNAPILQQPKAAPVKEELGDAVTDVSGRKGRWSRDGRHIVYADGSRKDLNPAKTMQEFQDWFKQERAKQQLVAGDLDIQQGRQALKANEQKMAGKSQGSVRAAPSGYRWNGDNLEAIPGGPADASTKPEKPVVPNEDERRSAGLALRMENAVKAAKAMPDAEAPELLPSALRTLGADTAANALTSAKRQQVETAQLDALDAALTLATGAAYTKEQLKNLSRSYFPQIGDAPETIEAKRKRFEDVIATARIRAGRAQGDIAKVSGGGSAPAAAVEHLKRNPGLAADFDAKYGPGSAAKVLGR